MVSTAADPAPSARRAARVVAALFLFVAVAGFVPGLTAHLGRIEPAGWGSRAVLLGVLRVSVAGNLIHLVMAGAGWLAAASDEASRRFLVYGGAAYAALSGHGVLVARLVADSQPVPDRGATVWVPVAAGLAMAVTGLLTQPRGVGAPGR